MPGINRKSGVMVREVVIGSSRDLVLPGNWCLVNKQVQLRGGVSATQHALFFRGMLRLAPVSNVRHSDRAIGHVIIVPRCGGLGGVLAGTLELKRDGTW